MSTPPATGLLDTHARASGPDADAAVRGSLTAPTIHDTWESMYRTSANERFFELVFDEVTRLASRRGPSPTFLDAGCGIGAHASRLARRDFVVQAVDVSGVVVERARESLARQGLSERVDVRQADLLNLPFETNTFDNTLSWGVLMHVPDVARALGELARVTQRSGIVILNEINSASPEAHLLRLLFPRIAKSDVRITRTPAGFEHWAETESGPLMWRHADLDWLVREASDRGLVLRRRIPSQFTELYAEMPSRWIADAMHAVNRVWFTRVRAPGPAMANVLVFEKV